ncbi:MAG: HlyD family efflux transporter periplasmic adaptor subunit [Pseudomonadota bacterium]
MPDGQIPDRAPLPTPAPVAQPPVTDTARPVAAEEASAPAPRATARRRLLLLALPAAIVIGGGYMWLSGGRYETTDNAALHQARVAIASDLSGRVVTSTVADNAVVRAGDVLFQVDPEKYRLALAQAEAALSQARLQVEQLKAAYAVAVAQERVAAAEAEFRATEFRRAQSLTGRGVATDSSLSAARSAARKADEALASAHESVLAARAALGGDPTIEADKHPAVLAAMAARDKAAYDLSLTTVKAPADGVIYQAASFKPGQFVTASAPLFVLVETGDLWVDANFKETQLTGIAPGQPAKIEFDQRPGVTADARVEAIGAGTGAEFSVLPAQNATGNWVKVTQRVPVRLRLTDPTQAAGLGSGVSASVTVDTGRPSALSLLLARAEGRMAGAQAAP